MNENLIRPEKRDKKHDVGVFKTRFDLTCPRKYFLGVYNSFSCVCFLMLHDVLRDNSRVVRLRSNVSETFEQIFRWFSIHLINGIKEFPYNFLYAYNRAWMLGMKDVIYPDRQNTTLVTVDRVDNAHASQAFHWFLELFAVVFAELFGFHDLADKLVSPVFDKVLRTIWLEEYFCIELHVILQLIYRKSANHSYNPMVNDSLDQCFSKTTKQVISKVEKRLNSFKENTTFTQMVANARASTGSILQRTFVLLFLRRIPTRVPEGAIGHQAMLFGLSKLELNDSRGKLMSYDAKKRRYGVQLAGKTEKCISVRPDNLFVLWPAEYRKTPLLTRNEIAELFTDLGELVKQMYELTDLHRKIRNTIPKTDTGLKFIANDLVLAYTNAIKVDPGEESLHDRVMKSPMVQEDELLTKLNKYISTVRMMEGDGLRLGELPGIKD